MGACAGKCWCSCYQCLLWKSCWSTAQDTSTTSLCAPSSSGDNLFDSISNRRDLVSCSSSSQMLHHRKKGIGFFTPTSNPLKSFHFKRKSKEGDGAMEFENLMYDFEGVRAETSLIEPSQHRGGGYCTDCAKKSGRGQEPVPSSFVSSLRLQSRKIGLHRRDPCDFLLPTGSSSTSGPWTPNGPSSPSRFVLTSSTTTTSTCTRTQGHVIPFPDETLTQLPLMDPLSHWTEPSTSSCARHSFYPVIQNHLNHSEPHSIDPIFPQPYHHPLQPHGIHHISHSMAHHLTQPAINFQYLKHLNCSPYRVSTSSVNGDGNSSIGEREPIELEWDDYDESNLIEDEFGDFGFEDLSSQPDESVGPIISFPIEDDADCTMNRPNEVNVNDCYTLTSGLEGNDSFSTNSLAKSDEPNTNVG